MSPGRASGGRLQKAIRDRLARVSRYWSGLPRFCKDGAGSLSVLMAVLGMALVVTLGAAIDLARWASARQQTLQAIDAALLAGARALQLGKSDDETIRSASSYYRDNSRNRLPLASDTISFKVVDGRIGVSAEGAAFIATYFLAIVGVQRLPLVDLAGEERATAHLPIGDKASRHLEIALALDISAPMGGQSLQDLKNAAYELVELVVWDDQSRYTARMALAPFSSAMRLSAGLLADVTDPSVGSIRRGSNVPCYVGSEWRTCFETFQRQACVVERIGEDAYTDAAPGPDRHLMWLFTPMRESCAAPAASLVLPLTNNKVALKSLIDALQAGGGRAGHLGTAWAWYLLSPNWAEYFEEASQPEVYGAADIKKIAILVIGGAFDTAYSEYGIEVGTPGAPEPSGAATEPSRAQAAALCAGMKSRSIEVFTIGFGTAGDASAIETLNACASSAQHIYRVENGGQLKDAARDIAAKLLTVYLSH